MFNIFLILFVFAELSFYLLIAQTGIVEVFHSDILAIIYLPFGGVIGTYLSAKIPFQTHYKAFVLLYLQALITFLYPDFTPVTLFILGLAVGGISPIIIHTLKNATLLDLGLSLASAYAFGTFMFNSDPSHRELLGLILSVIAIFGYIFTQDQKIPDLSFQKEFYSYPLYLMLIWVFLDSSLFETLSRDITTPIWRGGYTFEIALFHIIGVIAAINLKLDYFFKSLFITLLFILSYLFYFMHEAFLLSIIYPFVISYYNVVILQSLIKLNSLKSISVYMIFIGWIASGTGLMIALEGFIKYLPALLLVIFVYDIIKQLNFKKELSHV